MPQPLEDPMDPRSLPTPNQRAGYIANFLPGHPWRKKPEGRTALHRMELNPDHPWGKNPSVLQGGLTDRQIDVLLAEYAAREVVRVGWTTARGTTWNTWLDDVLTTSVEIQPTGRAVVREHSGLVIALRFAPTGQRKGSEPFVSLEGVEITSPVTPPAVIPELVDLSVVYAAFLMEMERIESGKPKQRSRARAFYKVADRPEPGKPPKTAYYAAILAEVEALQAEGREAAPEKRVADRYGVNYSTFRYQISRAKEIRAAGGKAT